MRIPIRNKADHPLTVFLELQCEEFEVPVGGEAIVRLADGRPHSIDIDDAFVTIWDGGGDATIEVVSSGDKRIDDALSLTCVWLHRLGAEAEALLINDTVERLEPSIGYFRARDRVFRAFHAGFSGSGFREEDETLAACCRAGAAGARLNDAARASQTFPELGAAPFDTDTAQSAFNRALGNVRFPQQSGRTGWRCMALEPVTHGFRNPIERTPGLGDQVRSGEWQQCHRLPPAASWLDCLTQEGRAQPCI